MMKRKKLVSVIITTKNEDEVIGKLIRSIKGQTYKNIEIILIDNNSTDRTVVIAEKMKVNIYNFGPERSAQRNFGADKAKGDYYLFIDADMELTKEVVEQCIEQINKEIKVGAIAIPEESIAVTYWGKVKAYERSFYNQGTDPITDAARFFPKRIFKESGGYDETITGPEDWDLSDNIRKMRYKISRISARIIHRERVPSLLSLAKKKFYYGLRLHRYLSKQHLSTINPKTVYFLRPVFYKNFHKILGHPILFLGLFIMLSLELLAGGLGYFYGRIRRF